MATKKCGVLFVIERIVEVGGYLKITTQRGGILWAPLRDFARSLFVIGEKYFGDMARLEDRPCSARLLALD